MPSLTTIRSSGHMIADRRHAYAQAAFDEKDFGAAVDLAQQTLELAPASAPAHALLGRALAALGRTEEAVAALRQALALEPDDALGLRIDLARLGALEPDAAITGGYVRALFDDYASQFDRHLVKALNYRGPELIVEALLRATASRGRPYLFPQVLDLGCGTGLMARALQGAFGTIEGVDLSPRMLAQAAKTQLYASLGQGELVTFLEERPAAQADLVVAADVFVYMADLETTFRETRRVLVQDGFFAFTVQATEGEGFALGEDARYAHSETYLRNLVEACGFEVVSFEDASIRQDRGADVAGFLVVLEK